MPSTVGCFLGSCGCPPTFAAPSAPSWCGDVNVADSYASLMTSEYCQGSVAQCVDCSGVWCTTPPSPPDLPAPPLPPPTPPSSPPPPEPPPGWQWEHGYATRYWDCCKPSCSWKPNVAAFLEPARHCDASGATLAVDTDTSQSVSACEGGSGYTCIDHVPATDPDDPSIAYAFAATPGTDPRGTCGTCFNVTFPGAGHYSATDPGSIALHAQRKSPGEHS